MKNCNDFGKVKPSERSWLALRIYVVLFVLLFCGILFLGTIELAKLLITLINIL